MDKRTTSAVFDLEEEHFCEEIEELVAYLNKCKRNREAPELQEVGAALDWILFRHRRMQEEMLIANSRMED